MALIPTDRLIDWEPGTTVGVRGGIPTGWTEVLLDGLDNTDTTDVTAALNAEIAGADANTKLILPEGDYRADSTIVIGRSDVILAGQSWNTRIRSRAAGVGVSLGTVSGLGVSPSRSSRTISSGIAKGSTTVNIPDASGISVGDLILLMFEADPDLPIVSTLAYGIDTYQSPHRQLAVVTSKTAGSVTFFPPLFDDYGGGTLEGVVLNYGVTIQNAGIENLQIDGSEGGTQMGIYWTNTIDCWLKEVKTAGMSNYGAMGDGLLFWEVRRCWLRGKEVEGPNGAGMIAGNSCAGLIEDNNFPLTFPGIEINGGCAGNFFSRNYCHEAQISINHNPHNHHNLYEGNRADVLISDGYFGGSSEDTIFRNHAGIITLKRFTRNASVVCNFVDEPVILGQPNIGNFEATGCATLAQAEGTLTTRTSASVGTITGPTGHTVTTGQSITLTWEYVDGSYKFVRSRRGVTVGMVSGNAIPVSGGYGDDLPAQDSAIYIPNTNAALQDPWADFNMTGTITDRVGDNDCAITLDGGSVSVGRVIRIVWGSMDAWDWTVTVDKIMTVTAVAGSEVTLTSAGGNALPAESTVVSFGPGPESHQELDMDVGASLVAKGNRVVGGSAETLDGDTAPDSLVYSEKPQWLVDADAEAGLTFNLAPYTPEDSAEPPINSIPAEARYNGVYYMGDVLTLNQTANTDPVTELVRRGAAPGGPLADAIIQHSGPYPSQPNNNYVYGPVRGNGDHVLVFPGSISLAQAQASRNALDPI